MLSISTPPPFRIHKEKPLGTRIRMRINYRYDPKPCFPPFLWGEGGAGSASEINADFILTWFLAGSPMSLSVSVKAT